MNETESIIGAKVRALRALLNLNQSDFAKKADIPRTKLSEIESGRYIPTEDYIKDIETALGISLNDSRLEQFLTLKPSLAGQETQPDPDCVAA